MRFLGRISSSDDLPFRTSAFLSNIIDEVFPFLDRPELDKCELVSAEWRREIRRSRNQLAVREMCVELIKVSKNRFPLTSKGRWQIY